MNTEQPYELHNQGGGGFVSFDSRQGDIVALPLISLTRASLHTRDKEQELVLDFESAQVRIHGSGITSLMDHLLAGRVKMIRTGTFDECHVQTLEIVDA
jgi:hypothetical protein